MDATIRNHLDRLLSLLPKPQNELDKLVEECLQMHSSTCTSSTELQRTEWEIALRRTVFDLAETEDSALGDHNTKYYDQVGARLDLVLTFADHNAVNQGVPLTIIEDLLDTQTIPSCTHVFAYLQSHSARLTKGLVPNKGPALTLLRSLNDLLKRLSKTGQSSSAVATVDSSTIVPSSNKESKDGAAFCGRILCFLSDVFHLTERSGVNLRGEYGPAWDGPGADMFDPEVSNKKEEGSEESKMQDVDSESEKDKDKDNKQEDLYSTFWSLQTLFSRPALFSVSPPQIGAPSTFQKFKQAVEKVLPVLREANVRDRAVMGSRASSNSKTPPTGPSSLKRKRDLDDSELVLAEKGEEYFFAKFLTSSDLLELELADPLFRRQFITQLLILCTHLLTFAKAAKTSWVTQRNRSMQMDFTLDPDDEKLCMSTISDCYTELKSTYPSGTAFAQSVKVILEREKNWIKWKNELCPDFRKLPAYFDLQGSDTPNTENTKITMEEATRQFRLTSVDPPKWPHKYGTEPITEIWLMGYRGLSDLESSFHPGDPPIFLQKLKLEDMKITKRQKFLTDQAAAKQARMEKLRQKKEEEEEERERERDKEREEEEEEGKLKEVRMDVDEKAVVTAAAAAAASTSSEAPPTDQPSPAGPSQAAAAHPSLPSKPLLNSSEAKPRGNTPQPPPKATPPVPTDEVIARSIETKDRWVWLALRAARDTHLKYFATNGAGDVEQLIRDANNPHWRRKEDGKDGSDGGKDSGKQETKKEENNNSVSVPGDANGTTPSSGSDSQQISDDVMKDADSGLGNTHKEGDSKPTENGESMQVDQPTVGA